MQETWVWSLGWEDPLEKEMAMHSSTIAWKIPWTEEPGRLQSMGSQRVRHDWATSFSFPFASMWDECNYAVVWEFFVLCWGIVWPPTTPGQLHLDLWNAWRRKWQPTPISSPEESHGQRSLVGYSLWGHKESDMTELLTLWLFTMGMQPSINISVFFPQVTWSCNQSFKGLHLILLSPLRKVLFCRLHSWGNVHRGPVAHLGNTTVNTHTWTAARFSSFQFPVWDGFHTDSWEIQPWRCGTKRIVSSSSHIGGWELCCFPFSFLFPLYRSPWSPESSPINSS